MFQLICIVADDLNVRQGSDQVSSAPGPTDLHDAQGGPAGLKGLTEPIERKKPNVAALLSMY